MILDDIYAEINRLSQQPGVDADIIGYSVLGYPIYTVHIGSYEGDQFIIEGAIHAREWITAFLLLAQIDYLKDRLNGFGIYFVPVVNPDGVLLVNHGLDYITDPNLKTFLLDINGGSNDFSQWKANINAVDLNVNFDADWGGGAQNVTYPAPANFIGYYPNSEPEVITMINFTELVNPSLTLSYHTRGEVIYYGFTGLTPEELNRDLYIANDIALVTGYLPVKTENSTGGYSDFVSRYYKVPAYTIEVGSESMPHPIGLENLPLIFEQNKNVPLVSYNALMNYNNQNN